jgi:tripartite-type tricarboxylate transporter receptor subunit TctC
MNRRRTWLAAGAALLAAQMTPARAQAPARQLRILVPFAPGGPADTLARALAERLAPVLAGTRVFVDNKPGGGTVIATQAALAAPADGQTLLLVAASFVVQPQLLARPPYDMARDFVPLTLAATNPHLLVVHPDVPAANLQEFIAWARAQRGAGTYASFGNGSSGHLGFERFKKAAGIALVHVPYKGGSPAMQDLLGGQVSAMLTDLPQALPHVRSGRLKAIAVAAPQRDAALPGVPTFGEAGLAGFESHSWFGFAVRTGTAPDSVRQLATALHAALHDPATRASLESTGLDLQGSTPQAFRDFLAREAARTAEAIKAAGIRPE